MPENLASWLTRFGSERRMNYGLDRIQRALGKSGSPERSVYPVVIGGTNGKGSTALYVSAALTRAGYRTGTYLSPHLQHPCERFLRNLEPASEASLSALAAKLFPLAEKCELSYFEFLTLIAFHWAKQENIEFLILEVGLGGRLDATNVTLPIACAITSIDWDHTELLGDRLEAILDEKMGILRPEGLLFTGIRDQGLLKRAEKRCLELDAIYYHAGELNVVPGLVTWNGQTFSVNGIPFSLLNPSVGARDNAALAVLLLRIVFPRIPLSTIQAALAEVRTPGRMEVVSEAPRIVVSGDHNPAGIRCLKETLASLPRNGRLFTVCAFSPDKPFKAMYAELAGLSDEVLLTRHHRHPGPLPAGYQDLGPYESDAKRAVERALEKCSPEDTILITGSLYLVGEVRSLWRSRVVHHKAELATISPIPDAASPATPRPVAEGQNLSP